MLAYGGPPGYGPPAVHHGFRPPPHFGSVPPFGMGYPTNLGQGYSYSPYVQPFAPQMMQQPQVGGTYSGHTSALYNSYNSAITNPLYATPTQRQSSSDLYSSTSSLTMSSAAVQRAIQQPAKKASSASLVKASALMVGHPPKHPPAKSKTSVSVSVPIQAAFSNSFEESPMRPAPASTGSPGPGAASKPPPIPGHQQQNVRNSPPQSFLATISNIMPSPQRSPPHKSPQQQRSPPQGYGYEAFGLQKRYERYDSGSLQQGMQQTYSQYTNQNVDTYGSPSRFPYYGREHEFAATEVGYLC